jgi:hypothetical protein
VSATAGSSSSICPQCFVKRMRLPVAIHQPRAPLLLAMLSERCNSSCKVDSASRPSEHLCIFSPHTKNTIQPAGREQYNPGKPRGNPLAYIGRSSPYRIRSRSEGEAKHVVLGGVPAPLSQQSPARFILASNRRSEFQTPSHFQGKCPTSPAKSTAYASRTLLVHACYSPAQLSQPMHKKRKTYNMNTH